MPVILKIASNLKIDLIFFFFPFEWKFKSSSMFFRIFLWFYWRWNWNISWWHDYAIFYRVNARSAIHRAERINGEKTTNDEAKNVFVENERKNKKELFRKWNLRCSHAWIIKLISLLQWFCVKKGTQLQIEWCFDNRQP